MVKITLYKSYSGEEYQKAAFSANSTYLDVVSGIKAATSCRTIYGFFEVMPEAILFLVALRAMKVHNWFKIFFLPTCSVPHRSSSINQAALSGSEQNL